MIWTKSYSFDKFLEYENSRHHPNSANTSAERKQAGKKTI